MTLIHHVMLPHCVYIIAVYTAQQTEHNRKTSFLNINQTMNVNTISPFRLNKP